MRIFYILVLYSTSTRAQNGIRGAQGGVLPLPSYDNGHGWDIRIAVPGQPGNDYPTLASIPRTSFSCSGRNPGYYADVDTNCQVFRVCTVGATYGYQSFLCPNGTLFNQAVFVCDWWMNVNCKESGEIVRNKNDQFENLKLGPQLMKDIKKMLTHPVRNPVNTNAIRSKLIVMQNYKPPSGQLFPNEALLATPERAPNHIYIPTKAVQIALRQNQYKTPNLAISASTPTLQYIPPTFNTITSANLKNIDILQRQKFNGQNSRNRNIPSPFTTHAETAFSNSHSGQVTQSRHSNFISNYRNEQANQQIESYGDSNKQDGKNTYKTRYAGNNDESTFFTGRQSNNQNYLEKAYNNNNSKQVQYTLETTQKAFINNKATHESKEERHSLVSSDIVPPTILTKTLAFSRLVQEQGSPKSRITFKTWVLQPTKNAKLFAEHTPYTYNQPTNSTQEELKVEIPYNYNKPEESTTIENFSEIDLDAYNYNKPSTLPSTQITSARQVVSGLYLTPTTVRPPLNERILTTTTPQPTELSRLYLPPITLKPAVRQYLPPAELSSTVSNRYLIPNSSLRQLSPYQSAESVATSTPPSLTDYTTTSNVNSINLPLLRRHVDTGDSYNNLSFTDILSKENLDITINEIVNDTNQILQTASPENFDQYVQDLNPKVSSEYVADRGEKLPNNPVISFKNSNFILSPSLKLEPPIETLDNSQSTNKLTNLPFLKETVTPAIERTVSIKITIPESIANFLFKTRKDSELEILKTSSSNYLVFKNTANGNMNKFVPIGKVSWDGNSNLSTSQALIFSLLADSINAAKKYNNVIQENVIRPTSSQPEQLQAIKNEKVGRISNSISELTASQFKKNNYNSANIVSLSQTSNTYKLNQYKKAFTNAKELQKNETSFYQKQQPLQKIFEPRSNLYSTQNQMPPDRIYSLSQGNTNKIYSGQLYQLSVPEVTRQIINLPNPAKSNIVIRPDLDVVKSQRIMIPKNSVTKIKDTSKELNSNEEIFKNQNLAIRPARFQTTPTERPHLNTQFINNLLNPDSGITAQVKDTIIGKIPYPLNENKFVTYKKDNTYNLYSHLNGEKFSENKKSEQRNIIQMQSNKIPDLITFQFIPSEKYQFNDENVRQNELQNYQLIENGNREPYIKGKDISNNVINDNYSSNMAYNVIHPTSAKQDGSDNINTLYEGASSYSAPQSSIGNLMPALQDQRNYNSRIEDLDENNFNGYSKERPSSEFSF